MMINSITLLRRMNFSDFQVLDCYIDKNQKSILFSLSGGWIMMHNGNRIELGEGYFKFLDYDSILISAYNAKEKIETVLSENNYEKLYEICEIEVSSDEVIIKGFARETFNWIQFHIRGGIIQGHFRKTKF